LTAAVTRAALLAQAPATPVSREAAEFFESKIRPLLAERCLGCHAKDEQGGLRLDSRDRIVKGGDSGPAIVAGDPAHSLLIKAVRRETGAPQMPMGGAKLTDTEIAALEQWITMGAPWPEPSTPGMPAATAAAAPPDKPITAEQR